MDGRAFLASARHLLAAPSEANRRTAAGRAYYGLLHEGRAALERWGFPMPPGENLHRFVRLRLVFTAHPDLNRVGTTLDELSWLRNQADYRLANPRWFATDARVAHALVQAEDGIDLLDQIEADPVRRAAAIAALQTAWP